MRLHGSWNILERSWDATTRHSIVLPKGTHCTPTTREPCSALCHENPHERRRHPSADRQVRNQTAGSRPFVRGTPAALPDRAVLCWAFTLFSTVRVVAYPCLNDAVQVLGGSGDLGTVHAREHSRRRSVLGAGRDGA